MSAIRVLVVLDDEHEGEHGLQALRWVVTTPMQFCSFMDVRVAELEIFFRPVA